jgi:hypothetical protein
MDGKIWAAEAALLNSRMSKKAVRVDSIVCPFGNLTVNGFLVIFLFKLVAFDIESAQCSLSLQWLFHCS